jgi:allantoicase
MSDKEAMEIEEVLVNESSHPLFPWKMLLPRTRLGPDERHFFDALQDVCLTLYYSTLHCTDIFYIFIYI